MTVTRSGAWTGPGCHLGCSVLLFTDKDGKLVKCEGDCDDPRTEGRLCVRCLDIVEVTNHKDRLTYPMKRDPKDRGKNVWERISWDEAYDICEKKLKDIREKYGAESVMFAQGTGRDIAAYLTRLAWSFGSPNYISYLSGNACYLPRVAGCAATTGALWVADCGQQFADQYNNPAYRRPEVMFIWGNYPLRSNPDGFFGHWVVDLMKKGMKIVMIDPKVTWLSSKSILHLKVRPGTDAALALGMLNVLINEDLYDHEFVDQWCYGFEELKERVQEYPVEKMAEVTWVPKEKIIAAAHILAENHPAVLQWGVAVDMTREAVPAGQALMALFEITGNMDTPGGMIMPPEILPYAGGWGSEFLTPEQYEKRLGLQKYPLFRMGFTNASADQAIIQMETGEPYELHAAWIQTSNPITCMGADPKRLYNCLKELDFIVFVDLFMTPSIMALADIVLPAATYPERNGLRFTVGGQAGATINKVTQIGECKSDMQICLEMGKRFNSEAWPWDNVEEMFTSILKGIGMTFEELQEVSPAYIDYEYGRYKTGKIRADGQKGFNTATGRLELWSTFYANAGLDPLPYFEEPTPGPISTPELLDEFPYVLTTGARQWSSFHSEHRQVERMRAMHPYPEVRINPKVAEKHGFKAGDLIWIENPLGRAKCHVKITPVVDERIIASDHAWWFPEGDPEKFYEVFDYNINNCVPWTPGKSGFGSNYKTTLCKIYLVKEGE